MTTFNDVPREVRTSFYNRGGQENKARIMKLVKCVCEFLLSSSESYGFQTLSFDIEKAGLPRLTVDARVYRVFRKPAYSVRLSLGTKPYGQFDTINRNTNMRLFDGSIKNPLSDDPAIIEDKNIKLSALFMHAYDPVAFSRVYPNLTRQWTGTLYVAK
jgi:hypothetical protein